MKRLFFFLFIILGHCLYQSPFLTDVQAGDKKKCPIHECELAGEGNQAYCEQCHKAKDEDQATASASAMNTDEVSAVSGAVSRLSLEINEVTVEAISEVQSPQTEVVTVTTPLHELQPILGGVSYTRPWRLSPAKPSDSQASQGANLPANILPAGEIVSQLRPEEGVSDRRRIDPSVQFYMTSAATPYDPGRGSDSQPAFSEEVQDTGGSRFYTELTNAASQMAIAIRHRGQWVLPRGIGFLRCRGQSQLTQEELQTRNLQYRGEFLLGLSELLLQGKVIVRLIEANGSITLLHIHSAGDLAVLVTENGQSTRAATADTLSLLLTNVIAVVPGVNLEVYLYTEPESQLEAQEQPQEDMEIEAGAGGQTLPDAVALGDSTGTAAVSGLVETIDDYVNSLRSSRNIPGEVSPKEVENDLMTHGANDELIDAIMFPHSYISSTEPLSEIDNLVSHQASLLIFVQSQNQSLTISVWHEQEGVAGLVIGKKQYTLDPKSIGEFLSWLLSLKLQVVRFFYQVHMLF